MDDVQRVLAYYPQIYFACHSRHRRDPLSRQVLSERQASVLDHLTAEKGIALKDLAAHQGVTASTMSLMVDRLVAGGWVARERDAHDARRVRLRLTAAGERMKQASTVLDPQLVRDLLDRLTPEQRQAAVGGLEILAAAAASGPTSESAGSAKDDEAEPEAGEQ
ncbi:MAG TPA: MarR family winged helix-turn-helix transcriptional regulator [Actinocrinis sp.]|nr:MarR family winged helix-turn-helix transcriptional regulator [Actinocrinis sp.]